MGKYWKILVGRWVNSVRSFVFANGGLLKLGPYLPWKLEGSKLPLMVIYNQMIYIKEMTPRSPRKTSLGCETIK